eukprot:403332295
MYSNFSKEQQFQQQQQNNFQQQQFLQQHHTRIPSQNNNNSLGAGSMSQSIPNLRSFVEQRLNINQLEEDDLVSRGSETSNLKKPQFQKQGAKTLKTSDQNYKKNLFSAMTSRVIKQQQESQLNNSQLMMSQRSLTSLHQHDQSKLNQSQIYGGGQLNGLSANKNESQFLHLNTSQNINKSQFLQRSQSPNNIYQPYQQLNGNYASQFDPDLFHSPNAMKKQYSQGVAQNDQQHQQLNYYIQQNDDKIKFNGRNFHKQMQDLSLSTQLPLQEVIPQNQNQNGYAFKRATNDSVMLSNSFHNTQAPLPKVGQNQYQNQIQDFEDSQAQSNYLQQQLLSNYERAKNLDLSQQNKTHTLNSSGKKDQRQQYESHQILPSNTVPDSSQNQNSNLSNVKERDSMLPPYKIKIKGNSNMKQEQLLQLTNRKSSSNLYTNYQHPIQRVIQFGGNNCPIDTEIVMMILLFDMPNFRKYLCLTPQWHHSILEAMDEYFKKVECNFVMKNYEYLMFKKSYTNSSLIHFCGQKGIRVDRIIVCEVLNSNKMLNKCLRISYSFKYKSSQDNSKQTFYADYKLDVVKPNSERVVWLHKDEQEQQQQLRQYNFSQDLQDIMNRPYIQPITQICAKDTIEFAINLYCLQGLIDIDSIEWLDCDTTNPPKENVITYDKDIRMRASSDKAQKIFCDMSRICELEDAVVEWYDSKYFQRQQEMLNIDFLNELFVVKKYECAGIDGLICKIQLQAVREGKLSNQYLGISLIVKNTKKLQNNKGLIDQDHGLVNEVKRLGLLIDRYVDLELRIGDTLVIYVQRGSS